MSVSIGWWPKMCTVVLSIAINWVSATPHPPPPSPKASGAGLCSRSSFAASHHRSRETSWLDRRPLFRRSPKHNNPTGLRPQCFQTGSSRGVLGGGWASYLVSPEPWSNFKALLREPQGCGALRLPQDQPVAWMGASSIFFAVLLPALLVCFCR